MSYKPYNFGNVKIQNKKKFGKLREQDLIGAFLSADLNDDYNQCQLVKRQTIKTKNNNQKNSKHIIRIERGSKKNMQIGLGFGFQGSRITTSTNRSILFNILTNKLYIDFNNKVCADLSCGSGIVGFEMLSLGANNCYFLDCDKWKLKNIISANEKLKLNIETIYCFLPNISNLPKNIDIIFFDPPYENNFCKNTINEIFDKQILNNNGIMIVETKENLQQTDDNDFCIFYTKQLKNGAKFYFLAYKNSQWNDNKN